MSTDFTQNIGGDKNWVQPLFQETSAAVKLQKMLIGLLPANSLDVISFTELRPYQLWQYKASSTNPTLAPLIFLRHSTAPEVSEGATWPTAFQKLLNSLPVALRERLELESKKPPDERNPDYVVLNNLLTTLAKALDWLGRTSPATETGSPAEVQQLMNLALPFIALRGMISQADTVLSGVQLYLNEAGPNDPQFDFLTKTIRDFHQVLTELNDVREKLEKDPNDLEAKTRLKSLSDTLTNLNIQIQNADLGGSLEILKASCNSLTLITNSIASDTTSPSFLLGLSMAMMGIDTPSGMMGSSLSDLLNNVVDALLNNIPLGAHSELQEMNWLYNSLVEMSS